MFTRIALRSLAIFMFAVPTLADTTIDFESPNLRNDTQQIINPYVASGVTFTAPRTTGLVKESALTECAHPGLNQLFATAVGADCPLGSAADAIRADFTPAGAVTHIAVGFQTNSPSILNLEMYDSSQALVGSAFGIASPAYGACGGLGFMTYKGVVSGESPEPVAYVVLWLTNTITCPGPPGCFVECAPFAIDDFSFGTDPVTVRTSSWQRIKVLYRE